MAETLDQARDLVARARPRGASTPSCRTVAISRASAGSRAGAMRSRRDRRGHQRSRRLLSRPAFRRLSRGDGSRPAARHGDPRLRRDALHDRADAPRRLLPRMEPAASPGIARARRRLRFSNSRTAPSSPIAARWCAAGLRHSWECAWRFVGAKGALTWDGDDQIRIEVATAARATGLFDAVEPVDPPPLAAEDRVGGHVGVLADFVAAVRRAASPRPSAATTSARSPWCSARSPAPRPAGASTSSSEWNAP